MKLPERVTVYEVGPRDGLQNESRQVPTTDKLQFIAALMDAGLQRIEITSFVSPRWIPQLADNAEVARGLTRRPGVILSALVPNRRGLDAALAAGMREIAVFLSASETHNRKNVNKSIAETLAAFDDVVPHALAAGLRVRAYVSTVFGCPYEGDVPASATIALCHTLRDMGVYQLSISDTIGVATPAGRCNHFVFQAISPPQVPTTVSSEHSEVQQSAEDSPSRRHSSSNGSTRPSRPRTSA